MLLWISIISGLVIVILATALWRLDDTWKRAKNSALESEVKWVEVVKRNTSLWEKIKSLELEIYSLKEEAKRKDEEFVAKEAAYKVCQENLKEAMGEANSETIIWVGKYKTLEEESQKRIKLGEVMLAETQAKLMSLQKRKRKR